MRRAILAAVVLVAAVFIAATVIELRPQPSAQQTSPRGRIAWTARDGLWLRDLADGSERRIVETSRAVGSGVVGVALSPDGQRVVWSRQMAERGATGADLWLAETDGSGAEVLVRRDAPTTMLESPSWSNSGALYYVARRFSSGRQEVRLERTRAGGSPEAVLDGLLMLSLTPDEKALVYADRQRSAGQSLFFKPLDASAEACVLAVDDPFPGIEQPRVSPDGLRVAFTASAPSRAEAGGCGSRSALSGVWAALSPRVALAHGAPADVWVINLDGSGLRRVAALQDDEPTLAWSPDGDFVAALGPKGLHLFPVAGGQPITLRPEADYGWVAWSR